METLRWFLEGLVGLIGDFMDLMGRAVSAVAREFDLDMTPDLASLMGIVIGALIIWGSATAILKWDRKGNRPQMIQLPTAQTPDQVVAADRRNFVALMVKVVVSALVLATLISLRS